MDRGVHELLSQLGQEYDKQAAEIRRLRLEVRRFGGVPGLRLYTMVMYQDHPSTIAVA